MTEHHWWQHDLDISEGDYCFCGELVANCEPPRWLQTLDDFDFTPVAGWGVRWVSSSGEPEYKDLIVVRGILEARGIDFNSVEDAQAYIERKYREARDYAHNIGEGVR